MSSRSNKELGTMVEHDIVGLEIKVFAFDRISAETSE